MIFSLLWFFDMQDSQAKRHRGVCTWNLDLKFSSIWSNLAYLAMSKNGTLPIFEIVTCILQLLGTFNSDSCTTGWFGATAWQRMNHRAFGREVGVVCVFQQTQGDLQGITHGPRRLVTTASHASVSWKSCEETTQHKTGQGYHTIQ